MLKAFQCDELDLYAAVDAKQAAKIYRDQCGDNPDAECGYPYELTDEQLDAPQPEFDENEKRTGGFTSIRMMLIEHGDEPGFLAGSEF